MIKDPSIFVSMEYINITKIPSASAPLRSLKTSRLHTSKKKIKKEKKPRRNDETLATSTL
jgi:hypothetical protein